MKYPKELRSIIAKLYAKRKKALTPEQIYELIDGLGYYTIILGKTIKLSKNTESSIGKTFGKTIYTEIYASRLGIFVNKKLIKALKKLSREKLDVFGPCYIIEKCEVCNFLKNSLKLKSRQVTYLLIKPKSRTALAIAIVNREIYDKYLAQKEE